MNVIGPGVFLSLPHQNNTILRFKINYIHYVATSVLFIDQFKLFVSKSMLCMLPLLIQKSPLNVLTAPLRIFKK